jgi:HlyD family secretion protein
MIPRLHDSYRLTSLSVLLLGAAGCLRAAPAADIPAAKAPAEAPATAVQRVVAAKPERKTLTLTTTQPGRITAFEETPLVAKISGYVEAVLVDIGDHVSKDQPLVRIAVPEMQDDLAQRRALVDQAAAEVTQAETTVETAQAMVKTAEARIAEAEAGVVRTEGERQRSESEHARFKELAANRSVAQKLVDETLNQRKAAEGAYAEALAKVRCAQALLSEANVHVRKAEADVKTAAARQRVAKADLARTATMLKYTTIKAPYNGVVTQRNIDTGHFVNPAEGIAQPLLVVCRMDVVRVFVDVPELEAERVDAGEHGDPAVVRVQALDGKTFDAKVTRFAWSLDPTNRSLRTEIDVPNPEGMLRPGMFATVAIQLDKRPAVLVLPATAILHEGLDSFCLIVADGKVQKQPIQTGLRSGNEVEIRAGLTPEQAVILTQVAALKPQQPVEILAPEKK